MVTNGLFWFRVLLKECHIKEKRIISIFIVTGNDYVMFVNGMFIIE